MSTTFFKKLRNPALNVLFIFLAWISSFVLCVIAKMIFGDASDSLMNYNPFVNGFMHADMTHLGMNILLMFAFLIPEINQNYSFSNIFFITLIIALIYFPVALVVGIPAVGISGTLYFMFSRACLSKKNIFLYIFFAIIIVPELISFANVSDGIAHTVHIIGAALGFISLKAEKYNFLPSRVTECIG
jgi:membrane associated rhomboid family serine protease